MNLKVSYFDNNIELKEGSINVIEIENKKYFFRFISDLYNLDSNITDNIIFYKENEENNYNGKVKVYLNYFEFDFNSRKTIANITKYVSNNILEEDKDILQREYLKIIKIFKKIVNEIDLPFSIDGEVDIDNLLKVLKLGINEKDELLDNLFLLIDIEKIFNGENILIFVNLKQYLSKKELIELYKYAIYNQIQIILIDSQCYGGTLDYENKLIIDENLDEFVI